MALELCALTVASRPQIEREPAGQIAGTPLDAPRVLVAHAHHAAQRRPGNSSVCACGVTRLARLSFRIDFQIVGNAARASDQRHAYSAKSNPTNEVARLCPSKPNRKASGFWITLPGPAYTRRTVSLDAPADTPQRALETRVGAGRVSEPEPRTQALALRPTARSAGRSSGSSCGTDGAPDAGARPVPRAFRATRWMRATPRARRRSHAREIREEELAVGRHWKPTRSIQQRRATQATAGRHNQLLAFPSVRAACPAGGKRWRRGGLPATTAGSAHWAFRARAARFEPQPDVGQPANSFQDLMLALSEAWAPGARRQFVSAGPWNGRRAYLERSSLQTRRNRAGAVSRAAAAADTPTSTASMVSRIDGGCRPSARFRCPPAAPPRAPARCTARSSRPR